MSTYNENLNASVVASLQAQELKQNTTQAQLNAAMFTLYYAEDAKITAMEKLKRTEDAYDKQEVVKEEAVNNNNIAVNLVATANQEKQYTTQSISNTAVAAANVQVATNAIVNLASDMGSVLSILNAADYGSQIFEQALAVNVLMSDTAYNAEVTSQWAMEASALTAEITATTVADMATTTATSVSGLLTALTSQLDATTALQVSDNTALVSASVAEKQAEGLLADTKVDYNAAQAAYLLSINELNLNLQVVDTIIKSNKSHFTVTFDAYLNPFHYCAEHNPNMVIYSKSPVKNYYITIVKESEKSLFSIATAEGLIGTKKSTLLVPEGNKSLTKKLEITGLLDSNGDPVKLGEGYVVFVLAQFETEYKKSLNNFEDYLTAPSAPFALTHKLNSPKKLAVDVKKSVLHFDLEENSEYKVEYRCMFLPDNSELIKELLTTGSLESIEMHVVENTETDIETEANSKLQESISKLKSELKTMMAELNENTKITARTPKLDAAKEKLTESIKSIGENIQLQEDSITKTISDVSSPIVQEEAVVVPKDKQSDLLKPGFFFNLLIAENVTEGNYSVPNPTKHEIKVVGDKVSVVLPILENTTDNFGNPLVKGNKYIPVVLSYASGPKKDAVQFSNSLSDYQHTDSFVYQIINSKK